MRSTTVCKISVTIAQPEPSLDSVIVTVDVVRQGSVHVRDAAELPEDLCGLPNVNQPELLQVKGQESH